MEKVFQHRRAGIALSAIALIWGALAGLRPPGGWAATHHLFTYEFGPAKRALVGTLLARGRDTVGYDLIAILSYTVFAGIFVLLSLHLFRARGVVRPFWPIVLLTGFSHGFIYLAHTVGYFDHWGWLLLLVAMLLPVSGLGLVGRLVLGLLALTIHEGFLILGAPVLLFDTALRSRMAGRSVTSTAAIAVSLGLPLLAGALFLSNLALPDRTEPLVQATYAERADGFEPVPKAVETQFHDRADNYAWNAEMRGRFDFERSLARWVSRALPVWIALAAIGGLILAALPLTRTDRILVGALGLAAGAAPLVMTFIAFDIARFVAATETSLILVVLSLLLAAARAGVGVALSVPVCVVCILVAVGALLTPFQLFDGYAVRQFPFDDLIRGQIFR